MMPLATVFMGYVLGCFLTGYYLVRWRRGIDIRSWGSGNPGARNVGRLLGKTGFVLTLLGDAAKGALAFYLASRMGLNQEWAIITLIAAVMGHLWPAQLHFRGGKGMATTLGGLLLWGTPFVLFWGIGALGIWLFTRRWTRSGIIGFWIMPLILIAAGASSQAMNLVFLGSLLVYAHRQNLFRGGRNDAAI